ncbi:MAG: hypothetical protein AAB451_03955 [Patescibacteria group bacterium]
MAKRIVDITPPVKREIKRKEDVRPPRDFNFPKKILIAPFLIGLGVVAYFTLSKAEINIWPKAENIALEEKLIVSKAVKTPDFRKKILPGTLFEAEKTISGEFISSGKKLIEQKAEGIIRIYNNYKSNQVLVANTRLQAPLEKFIPSLTKGEMPLFKTVAKVTIPSKGYADVKVIADSSGEKYNIKLSKFSIPGLAGTAQYTQIYGESLQEFTGGEKKEISQVSKDDLDNAQNQLKEQGIAQNKIELSAKIPPQSEFLEDSFKTEILANIFSVKVGAEVDKFNYQIKMKSEVMTFNKEDMANFAKELILSKAVEDLINEASFKNNYSVFSFNSNSKDLTLSVNPEAQVYSDINEISLKEGLAGLSLMEAKLFLGNQPQIEKSQIKLWPFWQTKIPKNAEKIKLELRLE